MKAFNFGAMFLAVEIDPRRSSTPIAEYSIMAAVMMTGSASIVNEVEERLNNELQQLVKDIWRVGDPDKPEVPFGELFDDDDVQQHYEGLAATLKAAKKRGIVTYKSPILLKGAHDKVMVNLVDKSPLGSN